MNAETLWNSALCARLVLTLGHFLYQAAAVALAAFVVAAVWRGGSARVRYGLFAAALLVMAACPLVTFWVVEAPARPMVAPPAPAESPVVGVQPAALPLSVEPAPALRFHGPSDLLPVEAPADPVVETRANNRPAGEFLYSFSPYLTLVYLLGVAGMLCRLMLGLLGGRRLRGAARAVDDPALLSAVAGRAKALGLALTPTVAFCARIAMPTVIGVLRPMVLLPATMATGWSPEDIEAVLVHELAHLARWDHWANLIQRVIEAGLFFHPAVWLVSRQIRIEREHCCDDLAVAATGQRLGYAASLLKVAEAGLAGRRPAVAAAALAASDGSPSALRTRILRLLGPTNAPGVRLLRAWPISLAILAALAISAAVAVQQPAEQDDIPPEAEAETMTPTDIAENSFKVVLPCGATLELLAVAPHPSEGKTWWRPDGTPLTEAEKSCPGMDAKQGEYYYEFVFRVGGVERASERWQVVGAGATSITGSPKDEAGEPIRDLRVNLAGKFKDAQDTTIHYGIAAGPWKTVSQFDHRRQNSASVGRSWGTVTWPGPPRQEQGQTVLRCTHSVGEQAARVVAVRPGGEIVAAGSITGGDSGRSVSLTYKFRVPLEQIDHFEFQIRPYDQWAEFANVSLVPGRKTDPKLGTTGPGPEAVDLAIDSGEFQIRPYQSGGLYQLVVAIRNRGPAASPQFPVHFHIDDPDLNRPITHSAGPIEPGAVWNEGSMPFALREGTNTFQVVIDPRDAIAECDESNNRAFLRVRFEKGRIVETRSGLGEPDEEVAQAETTPEKLELSESTHRRLLDDETRAELARQEEFAAEWFVVEREYEAASQQEKDRMIAGWIAGAQDHRNMDRQTRSIAALGNVAAKQAVGVLLEIVQEPSGRGRSNRGRWLAVRALGRIGDLSAVPVLIEVLDHYNQNTQVYAKVALCEITGVYFGNNQPKWRQWWELRGRKLAQAGARKQKPGPAAAGEKGRRPMLQSTMDEHGRLVDKVDYPFVNDPDIIGAWKSVDFVEDIESFRPHQRSGRENLHLNRIIFLPQGKVRDHWWTWTSGLVLDEPNTTASQYEIREIDGATYLFLQWKSGDYIVRHMPPGYYVLQKVLPASVEFDPMFGEKAYIPPTSIIDEDGKIADWVDYPFVDDPGVVGRWEAVDFVKEIADFDPESPQFAGELFLKELVFKENGKTATRWYTWTKGLLLHRRSKKASQYLVREIGHSTYMFLEWKSGDYTVRYMKPQYYVLRKVQE